MRLPLTDRLETPQQLGVVCGVRGTGTGEARDRTPGSPPSAATHRPESSASAGSPLRSDAWRAFASAFSMNVG